MTTLEQAVDDALRGKERRNVTVARHVFHLEPIQVTRSNGRLEATGRLAHDGRSHPDEPVNFRIVKEDGFVTEAEVSGIDRGDLSRLVHTSDEDVATIIAEGETVREGDWGAAARQIVAVVVMRLR